MKCPVSNFGLHPSRVGEMMAPADCLYWECAWYNTVRGECLAQSLYEELRLLVGAAGLIADGVLPGSKPHEQ